MRIVNFEEFCKLPNGTIFSYWQPMVADGLFRRGDVLLIDGRASDYYQSSLMAESYNGEHPVVDLIESRWGMYEFDQLYVIYDQQDIATIAEGLGLLPNNNTIQ